MQEQLPITIKAADTFSTSLNPLLSKLEMWTNFQALKADWYGNEACILTFNFTLVRTLEENMKQLMAENWVVEYGYAYHYDSNNRRTIAFIAVDNLSESKMGIEQTIKKRLTDVANIIALKHGLIALK